MGGSVRYLMLRNAVIASFFLAFVGIPATVSQAASPRASTSTLPGYWLITGGGGSYAFNAPNLGPPDTYGSALCVNAAASGNPPYSCNGVSAAPNGTGYWIS